MWTVITGRLGDNAKATEKGFHFSVASNEKSKEGVRTTWVSCFCNYQSSVMNYLRKGTMVSVIGKMRADMAGRPDGEGSLSLTMTVMDIELLPGKGKEGQDERGEGQNG